MLQVKYEMLRRVQVEKAPHCCRDESSVADAETGCRCGTRAGVSAWSPSASAIASSTEEGSAVCQTICGSGVDAAIGKRVVETMSPVAVDVSLAVQQGIQAQMEEADRLRRRQVERARHEADCARRRYLHVDPAHRLVAESPEAEWNQKLRALNEEQER